MVKCIVRVSVALDMSPQALGKDDGVADCADCGGLDGVVGEEAEDCGDVPHPDNQHRVLINNTIGKFFMYITIDPTGWLMQGASIKRPRVHRVTFIWVRKILQRSLASAPYELQY
ncbi:hypothetical protein BXT84_16040 [Sulfobacillus thermotolerans]|uniref:Uncharacterized protein n=1 Tax=Sulfobacillus thermotolerans TaxID=338644 RepID=A0ABM6RVI9_9FIRM|nr:hypothetical protein BXT84_16040 [Sulfobacillus thermotolerans]